MKYFRSLHLRIPSAVAVTMSAAAGIFLLAGCANTALPTANAPVQSADSPATNAAPVPHILTGAELYAINCNRCHPERSPIERRSTEWKTILTHMRVRANLPAAHARLILQYLQDNSGS